MKLNILMVGTVALVLLSATLVQGTLTEMPISDDENVQVTLVNQEPDPAEPGNYVDIRFKFENIGGGPANNIEVELIPEYPFSLDSGTSALKNIGSLHSRQMGDDGAIVKYHVRVNNDAVDGVNELKMRYNVAGKAWLTETFDIDIQTHELILAIKDVVSEPKEIAPGQTAIISLLLQNIANSIIKDIRVTLDIKGKPFAPVGSSNQKSILYLKPGEYINLSFNLIAEGDADADVYQMPVIFEYVDELGTKYSKNSTIGLIVGSAPELDVIIDSTTIYKAGMAGDVSIKFVNKGATDIKFLNVKLNNIENSITKSNEEVYVGNIDSDDYETAEFSLFVQSKAKEDIILPLSIEYKDANNKGYHKEVMLPLKLYSNKESKELGLQKGNSSVGFIIIIVIVAVGLFIYIKKRRKKKSK